ncbi:calcium-binding protein [Synechococcus sp. PCC 6312]|uniref:beta strand repeat-containing protein n=1 Tax=Synechococcus sp. (strain ATCC 27167 / PCC 6312) TaxID=195253 RepID=UPI00029EF538|nr:calcium-binding protein [Synechococcus sp. PCC 6312]AFY62725.1 Ca2+-binding protein, RTX toxin [Synechococcus sp. PCC 6312]
MSGLFNSALIGQENDGVEDLLLRRTNLIRTTQAPAQQAIDQLNTQINALAKSNGTPIQTPSLTSPLLTQAPTSAVNVGITGLTPGPNNPLSQSVSTFINQNQGTFTTQNQTPFFVGVWGDASKLNYFNDYVRVGRGDIYAIITDDGVSRPGIPYDPRPSGEFDPDPSTPGIELDNYPQSYWTFPVELKGVYNFTADGKFYLYEGYQYANRSEGYILRFDEYTGTYTVNDQGIITVKFTAASQVYYSDWQDRYETGTIFDIPDRHFLIRPDDQSNGMHITEMVRLPDGSFQPIENNPDGWVYAPASGVKGDLNGDGVVNPNDGAVIAGTLRADLLVGTKNSDTIIGREGNDVIIGNEGLDALQGGAGSDRFAMMIHPNAMHTVTDFNPNEDIIALQTTGDGRTANSFFLANQFEIGSQATRTTTRVFYDHLTGKIFYDADGSGTKAAQQIGLIAPNLITLNHTNFYTFTTENFRDLRAITKPNPPSNTPTEGNDEIYGTVLDDRLSGLGGNDTLEGLLGNDFLDGGLGADRLVGGLGNDFYLVDNTGDVVVEAANAGIDEVGSSITHTLAAHVENLSLLGTGHINGTGNTLNNSMMGNTGNNVLNGGVGSDWLAGGLGNDTYIIDNLGDKVVESANEGIDVIQASVSYILTPHVENLTLTGTAAINGTGNELNNTILGNTANNTLTGEAGDDLLNGGAGVDRMVGGLGNDTYIVDNAGDVVVEALSQGVDTVQSAITYSLGTNLENLILTGTTAINGTGNTLANTINGNSGNNSLNGGLGADRLVGGLGNDSYVVDNTGDVISETSTITTEIDSVSSSITYSLGANLENLTLTGTAAVNGTGNALANTINGNSGNNSLNGGLGADRLVGSLGNDFYVVDNTGDVISETSTITTEIDTVYSSISYALGSNLENLFLTGSAANGTGNSLNNTITGNASNNSLNGGLGADRLVGGLGNDFYVVDNTGDVISETSTITTEIDSVFSSITYSLGANLENLTLTGTAAINGTGNTLNNTITGNSGANSLNGGLGVDRLIGGDGNDLLVGGAGNDSLTGGNGNDFFRFTARTEGIDTITDFSKVSGNADRIQVLASGFGGGLVVGTLAASQFILGTAATSSTHRFIYNQSTGGLFFDADGFGGTAQTQIATLSTKPGLVASDILIV